MAAFLRYRLCTGNGMMRWQLLFPKYLTTLIICIMMIIGASDCIYKSLMVNTLSIPIKITIKFHVKWQSLGPPFLWVWGNGVMYCNDRHALLLDCLITRTFLECIRMFERANAVYLASTNLSWSLTWWNYYTKNNSQISCKISDFEQPLCPGNEMLYYNKGIHCLLSI